MRQPVCHRLVSPASRPLLLLGVAAGLALSGLEAAHAAASNPVAFRLQISGSGNVPTIRLYNDSRLPITGFEMTVGDYDKNWDSAYGFSRSGITLTSPDGVDQGSDADTIIFTIGGGGLPPGSALTFSADLDKDGENNGEEFRKILFNNTQDKPNSTVKVTLSNGKSESLTLPDGAADLYSYTFTSEARPRNLWVESQSELANGQDRVFRTTVRVDGVIPELLDHPGVLAENIGERSLIRVYDGERVEITVPNEVYKNIYGDDITDSVQNDPASIQDDATERFTAAGISVNDVTQSGDPTLVTFDITEDTDVMVKWQHEYALVVEHDFSRTESSEVDDSGNPWAGPMSSDGSGNPEPQAKKNWIKRGDTVVAQVDGQVLDFNRPGLDVRYVPVGYAAGGPPNGATTPANDLDTRSALLLPAQILEPQALAIRLRDSVSGDADDPLPYYLWDGFSSAARTILQDDGLKAQWATTLAQQLNQVIGRAGASPDSLYDAVSFTPYEDRQELREETLAMVGGTLDDETTPRANRLLLEDVFPTELQHTRLAETTFKFAIRQAQPPRQQVPQFTMYGPGVIRYVWQIQYGVRVNSDDPTRAALAKVYQLTNGAPAEIGSGEGVFWFDPGTRVWVMTAGREKADSGLALRGWFNGDGHYFSTNGDVNSETGVLEDGGPETAANGSPVAAWISEYLQPSSGRIFRGLDIPRLNRAARVLWRYDRQALSVQATIGEFVFQGDPQMAAKFVTQPDFIEKRRVDGTNPDVGNDEMAIWDSVASRLYPLVPGRFVAKWRPDPNIAETMDVTVEAVYPATAHYPHIAEAPPVALDPDSRDAFVFKEIKYKETDASVDGEKRFTATQPGHTVLLFTELQPDGRGVPREFMRVRVVDTKRWNDRGVLASGTAVIGRRVPDLGLDRAALGTGYVYDPSGTARYNPYIYDGTKMEGLAAQDVYDMAALESDQAQKVVVSKDHLPGPVIPVNLFPTSGDDGKLIVFWYDDPAQNDLLLWPHAAAVYQPRWPTSEAEGLGRIVIASQYGSEGLKVDGSEQYIVPPGSATPEATTYDPSRFQQVQIYQQPDPGLPGYNPNEEHALVAPSLRFPDVSPRPPAVYGLRTGDLNTFNRQAAEIESNQNPDTYTSHPYVLAQFLDTADEEFKMRVYQVFRADSRYGLADQAVITPAREGGTVSASASQLNAQPHVSMEAGEPVIPFYPLGVVIGASPPAETRGANIKGQLTYWEDHRGTSWSVSGGSNAWFNVSFYYPLAPDFYWPSDKPGVLEAQVQGNSVVRVAQVARTGDPISFLPADIMPLLNTSPGSQVGTGTTAFVKAQPVKVLYKSEWPRNTPKLKGGETLTFSGGEYRADRPFRTVDGELVETEGLPGIVAFASAEVVYDSRNPTGSLTGWRNSWSARVAQVLDRRGVPLSLADFPAVLQPASGNSRVKDGRYIFDGLPSSLQRRVRYDPLAGQLEVIGLLNDKDIGDRTLTAAPPAVYVLEPNILTEGERDALLALDGEGTSSEWDYAVAQLYKLSRNPTLVDSDNPYLRDPPTDDTSRGAWQTRLEQFWRHYYFGVVPSTDVNTLINYFLQALQLPAASFPTPISVLPTVNGLGATDPVPTPIPVAAADSGYLVGLEPKRVFDAAGRPVTVTELVPPIPADQQPENFPREVLDPKQAVPMRAFGPGLALLPNADFLNPLTRPTSPSYVAVVENNDPSLGGSPITVHIIEVDPKERYRGAIKTVESDNVFDENLVLRHTGDFGANADALAFEWWYRFDDGSLNVPPPDRLTPGTPKPWKLFPDPTGRRGVGRYQITLAGNPNAPEALLADSFWFVRYRHANDVVEGTNWRKTQPDGSSEVPFEWAGAGNNDPANGDYRAQLAQGWIKRVLDAVNPYEARIRDFEGDNPSTISSIITQLGQPYVGPVALNPDKNVIENVGLIQLYETILKRGRDLSIDLSRPVSTPAIANALQLASTRISDFYTILGNEAYTDALDPTIGFGSDSVEYGSFAPAVFAFQNQVSSAMEEELALLRGVDDYFARPVYNRLFWNFTKGEGEAAYAMNYNLSDINQDGFIDEDDALTLFPQGHGDAWGHYLTALRNQYDLLREKNFNWVSRSEFYNLQDIVLKVDFLDERKFAQTAASKAKAGAEIVNLTYRNKYVEDPTAQWQGYTDSDPERAWGVQGWARRTGQGAYFDWIMANALLPAVHPNTTLEGIQKVDRSTNPDIAVISANLNAIQSTFDQANQGYNPLGLPGTTVPFDLNPAEIDDLVFGLTHFEQVYQRAEKAMANAVAVWDNANLPRNMIRQIGNSELEQRNAVYQEDLSYRNDLIRIFGKPYEWTIGPGKVYPAGYDGPDLLLYMYVDVREINDDTVPGPTVDFANFNGNVLVQPSDAGQSQIYDAFVNGQGRGSAPRATLSDIGNLGTVSLQTYFNGDVLSLFAPTFFPDTVNASVRGRDGLYAVHYTDLESPKVPLEGLAQLMPVTAAGYTFQAPREWGARGAAGELQSLISQMIQQEAQIASAIGVWDGLQGGIIREIRFINAKVDMMANVRLKNEIFSRLKTVTLAVLATVEGVYEAVEATKETLTTTLEGAQGVVPKNLPTGGLAVSPGDALAPVRGGLVFANVAATAGIDAALAGIKIGKIITENALEIAENELDLFEQREQDALDIKEMLKELENMVGDEPIRRIEIFKEIQTLKELSDRYRALVDEGSRLVDERAAYNKRVAAATQRNRYQDITFRVARNHALQTYRAMFDIAARYAYLAAKAYDYETNFDPAHPGHPGAVIEDIIRARGLGRVDDQSEYGGGGLAEGLAWLRTQYDLQKGQLGINNPIYETADLSLRTELFRILPDSGGVPGTPDPDTVWRETLQQARVADLWRVSEFRNYCRPFSSPYDASGDPQPEPGIVIRFGSEILAGRNFFGQSLSGADHAFDPSVFATKVGGVGIGFEGYLSEDIANDLPATPRVYLVPVGADIMSVPTSNDPDVVRVWNVLDARIPVPLAARTSDLDLGDWIPLVDSLSGRFGEPRRFSSFLASYFGADESGAETPIQDRRLIGRSVWNTQWVLIIPGRALNEVPKVGLDRFIDQVQDIRLALQTYGYSGN